MDKKILKKLKKAKVNLEDPEVKLAIDVINGKFGFGYARKAMIENAGYNYKSVQSKVNELIIIISKETLFERIKRKIKRKMGIK